MGKKQSFKYCPHCGHKIDINSKFCPNCGHKIPSIKSVSNKSQNNNLQKPSRVAKNNDETLATNSPVRQWFSKRSHQAISGVVALLLLCGIGMSIHHNDKVHQQQQTSQQQSNQNNNQNQNQNNQNNQQKPKPQSNLQQARQVNSNFLNDMEGYTSPNGGRVQAPEKSDPNKLHTFINTKGLSQYYVNGTDNPYFKQMLNWCENQSKAKIPVQAVSSNFHLHHVSGKEYLETYQIYYAFNQQPTAQQAGNGAKVRTKYQSVKWHTLIKKVRLNGVYHWLIVKSKSSKNVTTPSDKTLAKVGLKDSGQMIPNA